MQASVVIIGYALVWAGSETANHDTDANGYLEGAVESANGAGEYLVGL